MCLTYCVVKDLNLSYPAVSQMCTCTRILSEGISKSLFENSTPIVDEISLGGAWFLTNLCTRAVLPTLASPTSTTIKLNVKIQK